MEARDPHMNALRVIAARQLALAPDGKVDKALTYAMLNGVWPYFHAVDGSDPFEAGGYPISQEFVTTVLETVDKAERAGTPMTFYQLEDEMGMHRVEMVRTLRYAFHASSWEQGGEVWNALLRPGEFPTEVGGICDPWDDDDFVI